MDWVVINALAQVVAAVGVIVTLIYVAIQIRQNTRAIRRSAFQDLLNYITNVNLLLTSDRSLCELSIRARSGFATLDEADQIRLLVWFGTVFRHYQNAHALYRDGLISPLQWEDMLRPIERHFRYRSGHDMWAIVRESFAADFRALVDARAVASPRA